MKKIKPESALNAITERSFIVGEEITDILPSSGIFALGLGDIWRYRELLFFLAWRDIKVRYKQTVLGAAWAIIQPVLTMLVFSFIFGTLLKVQSEGIPYPVFAFTALLPWQLFAFSLNQSSNSLVSSQNLITKIYFPRIIIPIASVIVGIVDFLISMVVLFILLAIYQIPLSLNILLLPGFILICVLTAMAVGLWLSAMNIKYRDVKYVLPFITQVWMYLCPIAYSIELIPANLRFLYSLNPMTGVIEGFRWAVLGKAGPLGLTLLVSFAIVFIFFISGLVYFKHTEDSFADLV
jgi:lipopolysaccharide transport system permease protein